MTTTKPAICFVAHNAYGTLARVDTGHIGGIEVQTAMMARWLAARGYRVSMITWDEGIADEGRIDGVEIYKLCRRDAGVPVLRFLYPRWYSLDSALDKADADIIYYNCGDLGLGQVVRWARSRGRRVFYTIASDIDCLAALPSLHSLRERVLYRYGLKRADKIVTQTLSQQSTLAREFSLTSTVIPMPCIGFGEEPEAAVEQAARPVRDKRHVLWCGRFTEEKRPGLLLDVAEACPELVFDLVGSANQNTAFARQLVARAAEIDNVRLHGRVSHGQMRRFYQGADLLCSTSSYEGFPNVYLEAWSAGVPIVTSFDPDDVVARHQLGAVVEGVDEFRAAFARLLEAPAWQTASDNARRYFEENHQLACAMANFERELQGLAEQARQA